MDSMNSTLYSRERFITDLFFLLQMRSKPRVSTGTSVTWTIFDFCKEMETHYSLEPGKRKKIFLAKRHFLRKTNNYYGICKNVAHRSPLAKFVIKFGIYCHYCDWKSKHTIRSESKTLCTILEALEEAKTTAWLRSLVVNFGMRR